MHPTWKPETFCTWPRVSAENFEVCIRGYVSVQCVQAFGAVVMGRDSKIQVLEDVPSIRVHLQVLACA